jgi:hypothetical protein
MNQDPDWSGALEGKDNRRLNAGPTSWEQARRFQSWNNWDEEEANVGGGRVYGEYNNGPYTAGAEYNWDEEEENVGYGDRIYGKRMSYIVPRRPSYIW